jgi:hypothetical protein
LRGVEVIGYTTKGGFSYFQKGFGMADNKV